jgi:hypothetical protein
MTGRALRFILLCCSVGASIVHAEGPGPSRIVISIKEQKLMVMENGQKLAVYPVSTSKFGIGDGWGTMATPLGFMQVVQKIGDNAPIGAVFHNRRFTGEVLPPNAPGRDPITTRIMWLRGLQPENAHAFSRCIYIHGTTEEKFIGRPASFGCIRMKAADVAQLYSEVPLGTVVEVTPDKLPKVPNAPKGTVFMANEIAQTQTPPVPVIRPQDEPVEPWQQNAAGSKRNNSRDAAVAKRL